ncbi:MAG: POTRA domain-containing protein, partial [candidate division Zixibacteria bacterium]
MNSTAGKAVFIFLVIACLAVTALGQDGARVVKIEVLGNHVSTRSLILGVAALDLGSALTPTAVQESIHRLYGLGIFSDVQIDAEEIPGGLLVKIIVVELPKLNSLDFIGNKKIKTEDLKEKLVLGVGGYISPYLVHQKLEQIKELYAEK